MLQVEAESGKKRAQEAEEKNAILAEMIQEMEEQLNSYKNDPNGVTSQAAKVLLFSTMLPSFFDIILLEKKNCSWKLKTKH